MVAKKVMNRDVQEMDDEVEVPFQQSHVVLRLNCAQQGMVRINKGFENFGEMGGPSR